jgi:hypothetical protein
MKLHLISRGLWTVLASYPDEERCDVLELADQLERDDPREHARLLERSASELSKKSLQGGIRILEPHRIRSWRAAD